MLARRGRETVGHGRILAERALARLTLRADAELDRVTEDGDDRSVRPRWFHAVLGFGERCEHRINVWGVETHGSDTPQSEVDALLRNIETLIRRPGTGPDKVRELRRWAATKLAPGEDGGPKPPERRDDLPG